MLQTRTVTPLHLGSVAIVTLKLALLPHLFLPFVWIFIFPPPYYLPLPYSSVHHWSPLLFAPAPHLLSRRKAPPTWTLSAPASRHPPASAARLFTPRRVNVSAAVTVNVLPPLCILWPVPMSMLSPGVFARCRSLHAYMPLPRLPRGLLQTLTSSGP